MSPEMTGIVGAVVLLLLFSIGLPVAFSTALVGVLGFSYIVSPSAGLSLLTSQVYSQFTSYPISVIPMFILMGSFALPTGIGRKLYNTAYTCLGNLPGGLAVTTVAACAAFGAICGSSAAASATMGKISIGEMRKFGYSDTLSTGSVATAGGLAILIPPSGTLAIYGIITMQPIGKLLISGIIPGMITAVLLIMTIFVICRVNPASGPRGVATTWKQKARSLTGIIDTLIVFVISMGGLFAGFFTPTQAGGIGAVGILFVGLARRALTWKGFIEGAVDALRTSSMVLLLIAGGVTFGRFMTVSNIPTHMAEAVGLMSLPPIVIMIMMFALYYFLGCLIDGMTLLILVVPILYPIAVDLGFDPIWFGVIVVVLSEVANITPPVGVNVYVVKGVAPEVPLETIFKGILPFLIPLTISLALFTAFPKIVTFLSRFVTY